MAWHVVIAGGGFGGFYAARTLEKVLPPQAARITLVNDVNFLLYTPLLPGAAAGSLEPRHVVVPLREELRRTDLRLGTVVGATPAERTIQVRGAAGVVEDLHYDQLVVALGSVSRTLPVPGLAEHGLGFKSLPEAIQLRNHVIRTLEVAETLEDPAERQAWLSYVFVGAGYAGLEGLAELQDFAADVIQLYPRCRTQGMRWILVEARDRVMPEIPAGLAEFATRELRGRGIEMRLGTTLQSAQADRVTLSGGEVVPTRTLVWTAGVKPHPVIARLGLALDDRGRIRVDATMRAEGQDAVWAIGDAAAVPDPARKGREPTPPTAQHAIRQGRTVARNVAASLGNGRVRPFRFKTKGVFVDMGQGQAVATTLGIRWRGVPAWWLARSYHLAMLPGTKRKLRLLVDWNIQLLFGRDTSELGGLGRAPQLGHDPTGGDVSSAPADAAADGVRAPDAPS
ncbi:NAD(P)/FAD-dependent oxidoreductase [Baekduia soli]|uniref:NAD(P)/FAD-dependent oxidoreductase n=1 Tax=Baekduia soli TaxID=496014 RepID=A0A5B8U920_9ACTN|nr:NAD(P)/FAD-dependent oxidoreductase [Baekduia soli]QEC49636.1 NAD(P)/FAD-dependent oxidoreductase [Baekduia soli]